MRQIGYFKAMGIGGFHIHPRTGLDTEYLGDEFMAMVRACRDKAEAGHCVRRRKVSLQ